MAVKPKCLFCAQEFNTVDEVILHLLFDRCQPETTKQTETEVPPVNITRQKKDEQREPVLHPLSA